MKTIEFQAKVKDGKIEIPRQYRGKIAQQVRVIVLIEEKPKRESDFIDHLLRHPVRVKGFHPLNREEIYAE